MFAAPRRFPPRVARARPSPLCSTRLVPHGIAVIEKGVEALLLYQVEAAFRPLPVDVAIGAKNEEARRIDAVTGFINRNLTKIKGIVPDDGVARRYKGAAMERAFI